MASNDEMKVIKAEIARTMATTGWHYAKQIAEGVIADMVTEAIDEEDEAKGATLRREAKAARTFYMKWVTRLDVTRNWDTEPVDNFVELAAD